MDDLIVLSVDDVRLLLVLLVYVPDDVLREPEHDALLRRIGSAMGLLNNVSASTP